ncbi:MAG TPA: hypothetical protein VGT02_08945 [Methylomirabilota bacterium]|nr:hypothetical protein [Methylomirabilota bacterium]
MNPWAPRRPDPAAIGGAAVHVERCATCHAARVAEPFARSRHAALGIACGQCHTAAGHPDFARPVQDGTCGGCHPAEYQQTPLSRHFATRVQRDLDGDRAARAALRREGFTAATAEGKRFVGDAAAGERGGRLCAACHYDEHRLGLGRVRSGDFCGGCHADRDAHFPVAIAGLANRCTQCHVRVGETVTGQIVNTHRFPVPGRAARAP